MAVKIAKVPEVGVYSLSAPKRDGGWNGWDLKATWKVPKALTDEKNPRRAEGYKIHWTIKCLDKNNKVKQLKYEVNAAGASRDNWTLRFDGDKSKKLWGFKCTDGRTYYRSSDFYPVGELRLLSVTISVCPYNSKGSSGKWLSATRQFDYPRKPSVTSLTQNGTTGDVSCTWKHDPGKDYHDNWNSWVWIGVKDSRNPDNSKYLLEYSNTFPSTTSTFTYSYLDLYGRMGLDYADYLAVYANVRSRGVRGVTVSDTKTLFVSFPKMPTFVDRDDSNSDDGKYDVSDRSETGKVTFWIDTHYHPTSKSKEGYYHPVTGIKLQMIKDRSDTSASTLPGDDDSWTDVVQDDGSCTAMSSLVGTLRSEEGLYTWVRLKSWNQVEGVFFRYSRYLRLDKLFVPAPSAKGDTIAIASIQSNVDGDGAKLVLAFDNDGDTGTEVTWSDDKNAWNSNREPTLYNVTWHSNNPITVDGKTYQRQATFYALGLTEGTQYYFRARRYLERDEGTTFGPYNGAATNTTCTPLTTPGNVTITVDDFIPYGSSLNVMWTYDSTATQRSWNLITGTTRDVTVDGKTQKQIYANIRSVMSGRDSLGSCLVPWSRLSQKLNGATSIPLAIRMDTGGPSVDSYAAILRIATAPTLTVDVGTVTVQPLTFTATCNVAAELSIVITAQSAQTDSPTGIMTQVSGDGIWSEVVTPEWTKEEDTYTATIVSSEFLELWDMCEYTMTVTATDPDTGLTSEEQVHEFGVDYARKAPDLPEEVSIVTSDVTDEDGVRTRSATITLAAPEGAQEGDLYDLYRVTPDGPSMCASSLPLDAVVYDQFCPFGNAELAYRLVLRTPDGVYAMRDYPYEFGRSTVFDREVRIDFGDDYYESTRGVSYSESVAKPFSKSVRLNGRNVGKWGNGSERSAKATATAIRFYESDGTLRSLERYNGPVFIRTSEGLAFAAHVTVQLSTPANTAKESVSLSYVEVDTDEFDAVIPTEEIPDGEGGEPSEEEGE